MKIIEFTYFLWRNRMSLGPLGVNERNEVSLKVRNFFVLSIFSISDVVIVGQFDRLEAGISIKMLK